MKFYTEVVHGPRRKRLVFGGDPDAFMDSGSLSKILYHMEIGCKLALCSVMMIFHGGVKSGPWAIYSEDFGGDPATDCNNKGSGVWIQNFGGAEQGPGNNC